MNRKVNFNIKWNNILSKIIIVKFFFKRLNAQSVKKIIKLVQGFVNIVSIN
jgi:hypothetical protein